MVEQAPDERSTEVRFLDPQLIYFIAWREENVPQFQLRASTNKETIEDHYIRLKFLDVVDLQSIEKTTFDHFSCYYAYQLVVLE